jgi:hypothetical protein
MRKDTLQSFENEISNIKEYIKHIDLINQIGVSCRDLNETSLVEFNQHLNSFGTPKRLFEYKAIIISLYGVLEKYINIWIQEHIDILPSIILDYDELPEKFRDNHFGLSIKLITTIRENRFAKYDHLRPEELLVKLSSCIRYNLAYELNANAFLPQSGNLKHSKIVEAFKPLGIELTPRIKRNKHLSALLKTKYGSNIANKGDDLFGIIDDLVTRRNDIAHGELIDNILNITEFDDIILFLQKYGQALFDTIIEQEIYYETIHQYTEIKNIKGIYQNKSILCFETDNTMLKIGDFIIVETIEQSYLKKEILGIQQNNRPIAALRISAKADIGVDLVAGAGLTKNQKFYFKKCPYPEID